MPRNNVATLPDRIPSSLSTDIEKAFSDQMAREDFRKRVKEIFEECTDSVTFMDKVKGYASREINEKIFKNFGVILFWLISMVATAVLGAYLKGFLGK